MILKKLILSFTTILFVSGCTTQQITETLKTISGDENTPVTTSEVALGLKAALERGVSVGADQLAITDGYLGNPKIKIPFPPEIQRVETTLRDMGLNRLVDDFVTTLNRGAERAAEEAKPIFLSAIRQMTIEDAWAILRGSENEATLYLERTTSNELRSKFMPHIESALQTTGATKYYSDIVDNYNRIPFVQRVNPDLVGYATDQAIAGMFVKIAEQEKSIRENPSQRTTDLLRRVFGQLDNQ